MRPSLDEPGPPSTVVFSVQMNWHADASIPRTFFVKPGVALNSIAGGFAHFQVERITCLGPAIWIFHRHYQPRSYCSDDDAFA
jgi:hypothetical protein